MAPLPIRLGPAGRRWPVIGLVTLACLLLVPRQGSAQERLCDPSFEDCRAPILQLIRNEQQGIDVAFWFMEDARYATELINRHRAGVPVRVLVDQRANASKRLNETILNQLRDGGVPMRDKFGGDILHFKMMLFHGQNVVEFSKANYTPSSYVPDQVGVNYFDEAIFFTNDDNLTNSFRRRFEDLWINTSQYRNFANVIGPLARRYPIFPIHPSMNFPPLQDFSNRSVSRYNAETQGIDAIVFRVTDDRQADGMIRAVARGAPVRLITEPTEYRNPDRLWDAKHVDRMWMGGVQIKIRRHEGLAHEAAVVLRGLGEVIFGSSNWTTASAFYQDEHNYFYNPSLGKPWFFQWFADQFERKWNDTVNYGTFQPLPPDRPASRAPVDRSVGIATRGARLRWYGGPWAHFYDVYFGTSPNPPLLAAGLHLGPSESPGQLQSYALPNLVGNTTYYWKIVARTAANLAAEGPIRTFRTAAPPPDKALRGDFDGDKRTDVSVFRPSTGTWFWMSSTTGTTSGVQWGLASDRPLRGDYDGDGRADIAVFRPSNGTWFIIKSSTRAATAVQWGISTDIPVPGDYDGDGRTDVAVFRPSASIWFIVNSSNATAVGFPWGLPTDVPILKRP